MAQAPLPPTTTVVPASRRFLAALLRVLRPLTWAGSLLFLPEGLLASRHERALRRGARVERGTGALVSSDTLELLRPNAPALVVPLAALTRARWMLLPRNRTRAQEVYVVRLEGGPGQAWLVEEPPPGFTRTLAARGLVSRRAYGREVEWVALAVWWLLLGWAAYTLVPWAAVPGAWREFNSDVSKP
jgi:hypothetical protein